MLVQGHLVLVVGADGLAKVLGGKVAQLGVVNTAGAGQHHSRALVVGLDVVHQVVPAERMGKIYTEIEEKKTSFAESLGTNTSIMSR